MPKRKKTRKRKTRSTHRQYNMANQTMKLVGDSTKAIVGLGVFSIAAKTVKDIAT